MIVNGTGLENLAELLDALQYRGCKGEVTVYADGQWTVQMRDKHT